MADHQYSLAAPVADMRCYDMPGAPGLAHVDPFDGEAQRLQLGAHHDANRVDTLDIQRPAILHHQPLKQRLAMRGVGAGERRHPRFGAGRFGERWGGDTASQSRSEQKSDMHHAGVARRPP